jgi:ATP-dependent DNA helicase RecQ
MGYSSLRPGQDKVVYNLIGGQDTVCILPTGAGKSLCYSVPTLCNNWKTLVFSPLVALMRDQVQGLQRKGVAAAQVSSTQTDEENTQSMKDWADGRLSLMFVAPERTENPLFKTAITSQRPDMVALDEAHMISESGDSFRPSYKKVGDFIRELNPRVVSAFTATMPEDVETDIRSILGLGNAVRLRYYPRRTNLILSSSDLESEMEIVDYVRKNTGTILIYCTTIKRLEALTGTLQALLHEPIGYYHGELPPAMKRATQDAFMEDKLRVMVATGAFGMGVDKASIRHVLQRDIESSIEATAQALGRGGRDGNPTRCHTFYSADSLRTQQFFLSNKYPDINLITSVYDALRESSDEMGRCYCSFSDISKQTGVSQFAMSSIIAILTGDNVIRRGKDKDTTITIRYKAEASSDPRFARWRDAIYEGGVPVGESVEVDLTWLYEKLEYKGPETVKKWLGQWDKDGLLAYTPPPSYPPIEIVGNLSNVDFRRLAHKASQSIEKLKDVIEYCRTPDDQKHAFMESRFGIK